MSGTGIFPNGPAQRMALERENAIRGLVGALQRIRRQINNDEFAHKTYGKFWSRVHDGKCVICGADRGAVSNDLDTLFCSKHCPVCGGWESVLDED